MITLDEAEQAIKRHYEFFAKEAPGVVVQEAGELASLWAIADYYYAQEAVDE